MKEEKERRMDGRKGRRTIKEGRKLRKEGRKEKNLLVFRAPRFVP